MPAANARAFAYLCVRGAYLYGYGRFGARGLHQCQQLRCDFAPTETSSADGFAVGDQLTITATYNAGPDTTTAYAELSVSGSTVAPITGNFPVVVVYTVSAPFGPSTVFVIENTNNVNAIAISVTCVAGQTPTPGASSRTSPGR